MKVKNIKLFIVLYTCFVLMPISCYGTSQERDLKITGKVISKNGTSLKERPREKSSTIEVIHKGKKLQLLLDERGKISERGLIKKDGRKGRWILVDYNGNKGYVNSLDFEVDKKVYQTLENHLKENGFEETLKKLPWKYDVSFFIIKNNDDIKAIKENKYNPEGVLRLKNNSFISETDIGQSGSQLIKVEEKSNLLRFFVNSITCVEYKKSGDNESVPGCKTFRLREAYYDMTKEMMLQLIYRETSSLNIFGVLEKETFESK